METPYPKPISSTKTRIGWIGIGVMGEAMASRLLAAGYSVTIYARTPSKALSLHSKGATLVASPYQVAQSSDIVFSMVGNPQDVRSIVIENNGVLSGLNPGGVYVDTTSSHPDLAREIYKTARLKDCWAVDAPVSGGDIGARDGKLAIFAAGDRGVVEWLSPIFEVMGKPTYMGEAGCGQSCKIANQIVVGANLMGFSEGLVFAEKAGLDGRNWRDAVREGTAGSMVMELFGKRMIDKDFRPGGFAEYMVKDLGMGVDVAEERENDSLAVLPGAALGKQLFLAMVANGDGKFGTQGLISVIQRINGKSESESCLGLNSNCTKLTKSPQIQTHPQLAIQVACHDMDVDKVEWSAKDESIFINVLHEHVQKGDFQKSTFSKKTWELIADKLHTETNKRYTLPKLKSKFNRLRKKHREFSNLIEHCGFSWDPITNIVIASEDVWADYVKRVPKVKPYRKKGLEHYNILGEIFSHLPLNYDDEHEPEGNFPKTGIHIDNPVEVDLVDPPVECNKRKRVRQSVERSSNHCSERLNKKLNYLQTRSEVKGQKVERPKEKSQESLSEAAKMYSIKECIELVVSMEDVDSCTFIKLMDKIVYLEWRKVFLAMSDRRRRAWLSTL
ncbi:hypothetical protein Dsin_021864 [Dipteronia sinensis]|uniref:Uncharacterized protein n=1 Tax=Dipteronia sinensis TaxID=43782 RepID=A0AAE0A0Z1_9ROSI|nr:hypothetical protein Dsin_021864 [Dipteronia sinensis]